MERTGQTLLSAPAAVARELLFVYDYVPASPSPPYAPPPPFAPPPPPEASHGIVPAQRVALFAGTHDLLRLLCVHSCCRSLCGLLAIVGLQHLTRPTATKWMRFTDMKPSSSGVMIGIAVFLMATGMCCVRYQAVFRANQRRPNGVPSALPIYDDARR